MTPELEAIAAGRSPGDAAIAHGDEGKSGLPHPREPKQERPARTAMPRGRNFH
jgi:hypothetical protein